MASDQSGANGGKGDERLSEAAESQVLFIGEVQGHLRRYRKVLHFTHSSTKAAGVMLLAAVVALIVANFGNHEAFLEFWHLPVVVGVGPVVGEMSMAHIINDIFMAVFFLLVGLEIKYEMTVGELTNIRQAALPIIAAVGGVLAPIVIYSFFNISNPETAHGWGVPTATDIAFALGIMALLGNRVPNGVRVFLSTLAVADDIIAILVIAIFYGQSPSILWLAAAAAVFVLLMVMNRTHVYSLFPYLAVGVVLWFCVFMSGVHSTIAGVLLAFSIPSGSRVNLRSFLKWSDDRVRQARAVFEPDTPVIAQGEYMETVNNLSQVARQVIPPATRLEHKLYPWVYFGVLPLFALTNADVAISGDLGAMLSSPVLLGVFFGLLLGKPVGIMLFSFLTVKLKVAGLPQNVNWSHMLGASILGGVGFTMAIFVANLAFPEAVMVTEAKLGILAASLVAGVVGFLFLLGQAKAAEARGVAYVAAYSDDLHPQTASVEVDRAGEELLATLDDEELERELEARLQGGQGVAEIVVELPREDEGADAAVAGADVGAGADAGAVPAEGGVAVSAAAEEALREEALQREERDVTGTAERDR